MKIRSVALVVLVGGLASAAACSSTVTPGDDADAAIADGAAPETAAPDANTPKVDGAVPGSDASPGADAGADSRVPDASVALPSAPTAVVASAVAVVSTVSSLAGSGIVGFRDGAPATAEFRNPSGLCVDAANNVYVADADNNRIRKITPAGVVSTLAGGTQGYLDGTGTAARFYDPFGCAVDAAGTVFVAERFNQRIRKVTAAGVVTTIAGSGVIEYADGTGLAAGFNHPQGLALMANGDLMVVDTDNHRIRRVTQAGVVTTLAGNSAGTHTDGTGAAASFNFPYNVAIDADGNAYLGDQNNHRIRKMTPAFVVTTIAGSGAEAFADGTGAAASFNYPSAVALDPSGNVYVADYLNLRIRRVSPTGVVTTHAGGAEPEYIDGPSATARFNYAAAVATGADGTVYVGDNGNLRIRKIVSTGIGRLDVAWAAPASAGGSPITGYTATATAAGRPTKTCTSAGAATTCSIERLTSGTAYSISVVATSAAGTGPASAVGTATPN